jgi:hypothetical protein
MKIIILTMPLVIAEYLPRPSAVDARPAFGRAVADRNVNAHCRQLFAVRRGADFALRRSNGSIVVLVACELLAVVSTSSNQP